ncbi:MAG: antibiotic biosynthesis monooxygenase [Anaerolineales bacterium]|jgi:autoinducer 2-degrading protein
MIVVLVHIHVKPDSLQDFISASEENARNSINEPGIARFDFIQQEDDPNRFVLIEAYREQAAMARHKETAHYLKWRETVEGMMVEPRRGVKHDSLWPPDEAW